MRRVLRAGCVGAWLALMLAACSDIDDGSDIDAPYDTWTFKDAAPEQRIPNELPFPDVARDRDGGAPTLVDSGLPDVLVAPDVTIVDVHVPDVTVIDADVPDVDPGDAALDATPDVVDAPVVVIDTIATGQTLPAGIAVDGTHVYWTIGDNAGALKRAPKAGGTTTTFLGGQSRPGPILVDNQHVYWGSQSIVAREPVGGGAVQYLDFSGAVSLAQDDGHVFFTTNLTDGVRMAPKDAGASVVLAAGLTAPLGHIAHRGNKVFWTIAASSGLVMSTASAGGGALDTIASGEAIPLGIAADDTRVYWVSYANGTVRTALHAGGTVDTLVSNQSSPSHLVLDGNALYWTNAGDGTVVKMNKTGGAVTVLASGQSDPRPLAVDATHVYWANTGSGEIARTLK